MSVSSDALADSLNNIDISSHTRDMCDMTPQEFEDQLHTPAEGDRVESDDDTAQSAPRTSSSRTTPRIVPPDSRPLRANRAATPDVTPRSSL